MDRECFDIFLWTMSGLALVVFIALYFVRAGYGMFRSTQWGPSINNRLGWIIMEVPSCFMVILLWAQSGCLSYLPAILFLLLFFIHYVQRSFIFPLLMKGRSRMPLAIMAMGMVFNVLNSVMQVGGLLWFPPQSYLLGASYLGHQPALGPRHPPSAPARRHAPLPAPTRDVPLRHVGQLLRRTGGVDGLCHPDLLARGMDLRLVDGGQSCPPSRRHLS